MKSRAAGVTELAGIIVRADSVIPSKPPPAGFDASCTLRIKSGAAIRESSRLFFWDLIVDLVVIGGIPEFLARFSDFETWVNENPLIVGAVIIGLLLVFKLFFKSGRDEIAETAHAFADPRGLQVVVPEKKYDTSPFKRDLTCEISGTYEGIPLTIRIGNDTQYISLIQPRTAKWYLEYRAKIRGWSRELHISKEGILSKAAKVVGKSDVEVGHDEFDAKFLVRGPESLARDTLTDQAMATLLKLEGMGYDFAIDDGDLIVAGDPYKFEEKELRQTTRSMIQAIKRIAVDAKGF